MRIKLFTTLSVTVLVMMALSAPTQAKESVKPRQNVSAVELPHAHGRQKMQHDLRKQAARRLKAAYTTTKANKMARAVKAFGHVRRAK